MHPAFSRLLTAAGTVILGKEHSIRLCLSCLLARGHVLIEDIPGVGKTTLARTLAQLLGLRYQRIQFTSDLLPADILGSSIYEAKTQSFRFHPGPIFHPVVLADEINRSPPRTQSALLEAMEERQVTIEGETKALPEPFFVIATQNPLTQAGTFPLPESQLDRFLMRIELGYPDARAERELLLGVDRCELLPHVPVCMPVEELLRLQPQVRAIHVSDALLDYVQALIRFSREAPIYQSGLSPRAGLALLRASQAWALMDGRDAALPEDVQAVLPAVAGHRLRLASGGGGVYDSVTPLLREVAIP
jgi:MoxR-like ATPase